MNPVILTLSICICGGIGSVLRYLADGVIRTRWMSVFPIATFSINITAGLATGVVAAMYAAQTLSAPVHLLLATGLLGGFSTFSTAINEMVSLSRQKKIAAASGYAAATMVVPVVAVALGYLLVA
ncbi:CrcB family protein [Bifidobacterium psychraerophilum]|jgi:CrcB protein|uniref:Fluoride-specific ion channel FluC n=1 Tax=Bifidobacterium psychraerophilum TaxID=218140 RepID=A0A087CDJ0_9BIFI|nr:CrcB family protein [Bifidobacterium psychraerophilum]KFI81340.1 CrcB-like protein [Bifidobacterium psychraerophilum]MCI1660654.1 CrcB family protein [Bifidobacterium psychraerophilum]MCI1804557.1 CrcB family protein [Bifidobacterium psychraerophilum]MCI2177116.1 CrcB family protein [Bifidobacterium psychraerophilum]MCI2182925.1 CrcB family protein [Bifidobacterium psychraerophilum]